MQRREAEEAKIKQAELEDAKEKAHKMTQEKAKAKEAVEKKHEDAAGTAAEVGSSNRRWG